MHKILQRQLLKLLPPDTEIPAPWQVLLEHVSQTYSHADEDRALLERSLELSSRELITINQRLRAERDLDQAIVTSMGEGLVVVDRNLLVTSINPVAQRRLAISGTKILGTPIKKLCRVFKGKTELAFEEQPITVTVKQGRSTTASLSEEIYFENREGQRFPVSITTTPLLKDGQPAGAVLVFRDISRELEAKKIIERQVAEKAAEATERRAQLLASIKNLNVGFIMIDKRLNITMINEAAIRILGSQLPSRAATNKPPLAVGDNLAEVDLVLTQLQFQKVTRKCLANNKALEFRNIPFGNLYLHFYLSPIIVNREAIGVAILAEDVTEARLLEHSKDEFFAIASHELRTPLSAIRGNTAMILKYITRFSQQDLLEMVRDIHESSIRLIDMVRDFLDLSRLQQGRIKFAIEPLNPETIIQAVVKEMMVAARDKGLSLQVETVPATLSLVCADRDRFQQVLINLIGNAIKFTDRGTVKVRAKQEGEMIKISVTDTGRGISPESQRLLFKKFHQTSENLLTRDTTRGTGLGLYISRLLVRGMGGTINLVSSEPGRGSTFAFTLPVAPQGKCANFSSLGYLQRTHE